MKKLIYSLLCACTLVAGAHAMDAGGGDSWSEWGWKSLESIKEYASQGKEWVENNPKPVAITTAAVAAGVYAGYKWYTAPAATAKMCIAPVNVKGLDLFDSEKSTPAVEVCGWLKSLGALLTDVYKDLPKAQKVTKITELLDVVKPFEEVVADPHYLIQQTDFIAQLNDKQKVALMGIFKEFTDSRFMIVVGELGGSLSEDQNGIGLMLNEAVCSGSNSQILKTLRECIATDVLTPEQLAFVSVESEIIERSLTLQALYREDVGLQQSFEREMKNNRRLRKDAKKRTRR